MTTGGWVFMIVSLSAVIGLVAVCYQKVLTAPREADTPEDKTDGAPGG